MSSAALGVQRYKRGCRTLSPYSLTIRLTQQIYFRLASILPSSVNLRLASVMQGDPYLLYTNVLD